jgi:N-methylhydantoinase A/oxoprolinase/acetone carboxylase beta subunit
MPARGRLVVVSAGSAIEADASLTRFTGPDDMTDTTPHPPESDAALVVDPAARSNEGSRSEHLLLGIDTGGTYTDAVVYDEHHRRVVAKAKAPTSHHDLAIGISAAIEAAVYQAGVDPAHIELVSLSTTLATNALVEGAGRPVCAVIIGFDEDVIERGGLRDALAGDPAIFLAGGHDPHGRELAPLDLDRLAAELDAVAPRVDGFAVMSQFSVRNPSHERAATDLIRARTGRTVTASHVLSAQLNGPKRAVTAILNARLVPIIDRLVATTERTLVELGVRAPVMVVRGDGSLVSAAFVRERPIETILSGPAASLVGAGHLTGLDDAIISDIGGTTTDIAVLRHGVPLVSNLGATVGGHRTMVAAVAMHTHGLGGDSQVRHDERAVGPALVIGPRRIVPVALVAAAHPDEVHAALDRQLAADPPSDLDGSFVMLVDRARADEVGDPSERRLVERVLDASATIVATAAVTTSMAERKVLDRLVRRGVLQYAGYTPTDANHVLGRQATGDRAAAVKAAQLFARRRDRLGRAIADDAPSIAQVTIDALVRRSAEAVLAAAFDHDGLPPETVQTRAVQTALDGHHGVTRVEIGLAVPLIGLGASAVSYYPAVADLVRTQAVVPHDADVANAIGAVVGRVRISHECTISSPEPGRFVIHAGETPAVATDLAAALALATDTLRSRVAADLTAAGAGEVEWVEDWHESTVEVSGSPMFVEGRLRVVGHGRPQL